jgi:acyl-coenzyme A synthetase/AMP-(fatty) acid ligase
MSFAQLIHSATENSPHSISDGLLDCPYAQLPLLLDSIDTYLSEQGVQPSDCIAIECLNSVPSAALLLFMLSTRRGFVLLPPSENKDGASTLKPAPQFCQYRLVVKAVPKANASGWQDDLAQVFGIESHNTDPAQRIDSTGKLFLRTSGSMGAAKIVVHSHESLLGSARNVITKYGLDSDDRFTIPVPIFHLYGLGAEFLPAIALGAAIDLQENTNLLKYLDRERRFQPTVAFVTPNLCEMLLHGRKNPRPYKVIVVSGQRIKEELFRAFDPLCGSRLINQYGSSELGPIAACLPSDDLDTRATTIGSAMPNVSLRIEENGDLYCAHPYHFLGYMNEHGQWLSEASEWHRTGDLAIDNAGAIAVVGRADASINRSGYLVLLADVETRLEQLAYVSQAVVVNTKAETIQGQLLVACIVLKASSTVDEAQLRSESAALLPKYAVPDRVLFLNKLPLLPSGKTDQQALIALAEQLL